ncbi:agamous-like MADS-box protein AGL11 [Neltuma alba]|uniref:agamous-like MADS-box protein AGL11 n=1 Tax=Neltuma alba TaxID=207710 RepID=UPI0010A55859|nr:agamous-like MADS-box protein AGL11 [Prosopis alba]
MGRGKIEIKRIENTTNRQVTFCKRRNGLLKKAYELSVLCDAEVSLIVFSNRGRLYEYSNNNIRSTIERYKKACSDHSSTSSPTEINAQYYQQESAKLRQQIQMLQSSNRHLMGDALSNLNVKELKQLENRLERGLSRIRSKKHEMLLAEIEYMQKKEIELENENLCIRTKVQIYVIYYSLFILWKYENEYINEQIAEVERAEEEQMATGGQDLSAIQALASRNYFIHPLHPSPSHNKNLRLG